LAGPPAWYLAELPDGAPCGWDAAHARVADQLGVAAADVLFAEPDLIHDIYRGPHEVPPGPFAVGEHCGREDQTGDGGRAMGPATFGWHLDNNHSQLGAARAAVQFTEPRTRIGHIDTGYDRGHDARPRHINHDLERNFVGRDGNPRDAHDPDNDVFLLDNSGHGTGTIGILAGGQAAEFGGVDLGGAPDAEVVPLRIADRVVLFYTSAFAEALGWAIGAGCDVISISMGGLPSRAWSEVVNDAYEAGICIVAAAGNNVAGLPTRHIVYPARYRQVIAVCGVMADGRPYAQLGGTTMEGNYGPDSRMTSALAAYTPNIPWPKFRCPTAIRLNGEGTSAATPQVAAAVALWFEKNKATLPRDWQRVEAVRTALFDSAKARNADPTRFGRGILQANAALAVAPVLGLQKTEADSDSFAFLRVLTGLGLAEPPPREVMYNLELTQRWLLNPDLQGIVPDPDSATQLDSATLRRFMDAAIADPAASRALRQQLATRYPLVTGRPIGPRPAPAVRGKRAAKRDLQDRVAVADPPYRRIRAYAVDPSFSTRLATAATNEAVLKVRWEPLQPGPVGEYLAVVDTDPTGEPYAPVDLDDRRLMAQDGWPPSEGNPAFHQQMVYAVAMTTITRFEHALGRPVLWRPAVVPGKPNDDRQFVPRLTIRPHALRQANAFYSPNDVALLFGYFEAGAGESVPGSRVYACLSHDIIAHETTHAVLDGMHRRFSEPSNLDVLAFHEAFADIVALMQHFTLAEVLEREIARTRGDLETESMLGSLAVQFGRATGAHGALRDAIGRVDADGVWHRLPPDPADLQERLTPHGRGAVLVAAVFDAFLAIYRIRTADLVRLATGGSGVLPAGAIHPDLVRRLAEAAAKAAGHVLTMCIRALDYIPPVDITFGEYLRGLITADFDLVEDDRFHYRVAFVEAFRGRGIYPRDLQTLSVDTLRWRGLDLSPLGKRQQGAIREQYDRLAAYLKPYADACLYLRDRRLIFDEARRHRRALKLLLNGAAKAAPGFAEQLGLDPRQRFEVHALRPLLRIGPDGQRIPQVVASLTQSRTIVVDGRKHRFRGGSTLVIDLSTPEVKYCIIKNIDSASREQRTVDFLRDVSRDPLRALLLAPNPEEPFAALHAATWER
jgi:subtilisin family serine protease